MRLAEITNGKVTNIILVDPYNIPEWCSNWPQANNETDIGFSYENGQFIETPKVAPVPTSISFAQLLIGLVAEGWLSVAEARSWRDRTDLPAQVKAVIATLPIEQQFAAETKALAPSEVLRANSLVIALGLAAGKTEEELDNFFRTYYQV